MLWAKSHNFLEYFIFGLRSKPPLALCLDRLCKLESTSLSNIYDNWLTWLNPPYSLWSIGPQQCSSTSLVHLAPSQVKLMVFNSSMTLRLHVCFGGSLLLFPWGFQSSACLVVLSTFFLKVWLTHRHIPLLTCTAVWCWLALSHRSQFGTLFYHLRFRIWRRQLLVNVWILFELLLTTLHVSEPYNKTDLTFESKMRSFVCLEIAVDLHTERRMANAWRAFPILAAMSSSVPPVRLILLPSRTNSWTSSTDFPSIRIDASCRLFVLRTFVFSCFIFRPTLCTENCLHT